MVSVCLFWFLVSGFSFLSESLLNRYLDSFKVCVVYKFELPFGFRFFFKMNKEYEILINININNTLLNK